MSLADAEKLTIADGLYAAAILQFSFQNPTLESAPLCEIYRFRGAKVCQIKPYDFDPAPLIAACRAKAPASLASG